MSFRSKLTIVVGFLIFFTVISLSVSQFFIVKRNLFTTIDASLNDIIGNVKNGIVADMTGKEQLVSYIVDELEKEPTKENVQKMVGSQTLSRSFIKIGAWLESDKEIISNGQNSELTPEQFSWYSQVVKANKLFVSKPYKDAAIDKVVISIVSPILNNGSFIGAVYFNINLEKLAALVNEVKLFNAGYIQIVTNDGTIVTNPQANMNGKNFLNIVSNIKVEEKLQIQIKDGVEFGYNFFKIPNVDWYISSVLDHTIAFGGIAETKNNLILFSVTALVLSIGIFFLIVKNLMKPVARLGAALQEVSNGEGDLTKRLSTNTDKEFSDLASSFNLFSATLQEQISGLKHIGKDIVEITETTSEGAEKSLVSSKQQLEALERLANAMNAMSETSQYMANNAQGASGSAKEAEDATKQGLSIVDDTKYSIDELTESIDGAVSKVNKLSDATNGIATVLKVINDIADQTNLLALNAAIEAARAGEQGRGFAVVADEVRVLAQRTQQSTTEVKSMIDQLQSGASDVAVAMSSSQSKASETVSLAHKASDALVLIKEAINTISEMNAQIASAAKDQSSSSSEVSANTLKIKDLSEDVSLNAEKASQLMATQSHKADQQNAILSKFIV